MHPVTKKVKEQVDEKLKGRDLSAEQHAHLQSRYDDIDNWMSHKPDWVDDDAIKPEVGFKPAAERSMLD